MKSIMNHLMKSDSDELDFDLFDRDAPRSMWNLIPESLQTHISKVPLELLQLSEHELDKKLDPDAMTSRLRISFWLEYDRAQVTQSKMRISSVYSPVCSKQYWCTNILSSQERLAWILCPPGDYILAMREVLMQGTKVIRKIIMAKNVVDDDGNLNPKAAGVVLKAIELVHVKVHGTPVIRMESKNMNINQVVPEILTSEIIAREKLVLDNLNKEGAHHAIQIEGTSREVSSIDERGEDETRDGGGV